MYSNLVEYVKLSPNCNKPRTQKIDSIVIHHAAAITNVKNLGSWFSRSTAGASSNYGVGTDGRIACYVEEENRAWTTGNNVDNRAITIEVANCTGDPDWRVSDRALDATIALCVDVCNRHGFKLNYTGDKKGNLHMHKWYAATGCPGPYLGSKFGYIADEVNRRLGGEPPAENVEVVEKPKDLNLPVLQKGSKGDSVKALQILLIGYGYSCGKWGADGDFGADTKDAVCKYQKSKGLVVDGIVGDLTWSKLLGV